jgi:hypothetical protein
VIVVLLLSVDKLQECLHLQSTTVFVESGWTQHSIVWSNDQNNAPDGDNVTSKENKGLRPLMVDEYSTSKQRNQTFILLMILIVPFQCDDDHADESSAKPNTQQ